MHYIPSTYSFRQLFRSHLSKQLLRTLGWCVCIYTGGFSETLTRSFLQKPRIARKKAWCRVASCHGISVIRYIKEIPKHHKKLYVEVFINEPESVFRFVRRPTTSGSGTQTVKFLTTSYPLPELCFPPRTPHGLKNIYPIHRRSVKLFPYRNLTNSRWLLIVLNPAAWPGALGRCWRRWFIIGCNDGLIGTRRSQIECLVFTQVAALWTQCYMLFLT